MYIKRLVGNSSDIKINFSYQLKATTKYYNFGYLTIYISYVSMYYAHRIRFPVFESLTNV